MKGKSTIDAICVVRQLHENTIAKQNRLYYCYIDLETAYDRIPREVILLSLRKRVVAARLVKVIEFMYVSASTTVRKCVRINLM